MSAAIFTGYISGTTLTVSAVSSGLIQVPMLITGSGITTGTYIVAGVSGSGSTGSYQVSISQSAGSSGSQIAITGSTPLVTANDYNTIQSTISPILGRYSTGYGQLLNSGQVSTGSLVRVTDWNALQQDITNLYQHQLSNTPSPSLTTASTTIKIKETDRIAYQTMATALANSSANTTNNINYPGCYALVVSNQSTNSLSTPTSGGFPYTSTRIGTVRPWGGTSVTNPPGGPVTAIGYITGTTLATNYTPSNAIVTGMTVTGAGVLSGTTITAVNTATFYGYITNTALIVQSGTVVGTILPNMYLYGGGGVGVQGGVALGTVIVAGGGTTWAVNISQTVGNSGGGSGWQPFTATNYTINQSQTVANAGTPENLTFSLNVSESNTSIVQNVITVTWSGGTGYSAAQAAQYFFNSGGSIQFTASMSAPGVSSPTIPAGAGNVPTTGTKNFSWYSILNGMGTVSFSYSGTSASGAGTGTSNGWQYFLANAGQPATPIFVNSLGAPGTSVYAPNQYTIWASLNAQGNSLTFQIDFEDLSSGFPLTTGTVNSTGASATVFLSNVTNIIQGTVIIFKGTGGNGLVAGSPGTTYYVASVNSGNNSVTLSSSYNNATASTPITITALSTGTVAGTTFQAAGTEDFYKSGVNPYDIDEDVTGSLASQVNINYASGSYVTMAPVSNAYNYLPSVSTITSL
jgi:hypothetical protein